jgi:multisubunit Na+/H+ antiporter MnhE subunit
VKVVVELYEWHVVQSALYLGLVLGGVVGFIIGYMLRRGLTDIRKIREKGTPEESLFEDTTRK